MKFSKIKKPVAFFCAEFAVDNDLPTYAGGLGILSGDILNTAASQHFPMVGIGVLYKGKHFLQHINSKGEMEERDSEFDHDTSFLRHTTVNGEHLVLHLPTEDGSVAVKSYHIRLSDDTIIFFLSTYVDGNPPEWVSDMDTLYYGDTDSQIRQQVLLGVGGIKLLNALNIKPSVYHINEGRPCFIIWEITKQIMDEEKCTFEEAWKKAKSKIVYTNHTLVAAGNLNYPAENVRKLAAPYAKGLGVDSEAIIKDGLIDPHTFSITYFALNISSKHSAVSKIHGEYVQKEWPDYEWIPITNGVHQLRWQDSDYRNKSFSDKDIWDQHMLKKKELLQTVIKRTGIGYDPERLVISWARRLAEYKQPKIIFQDIQRLKKILSDQEMPVQLLFAGNSHSADPHAKGIIEELIKLFSNELSGHAIFVPNYNISLANHLVSGSDVWLNTPKGNLEACGTSGMKAISNGVLNCTVLDGWTYEVDWEGIGWTLDPENVASSFYHLLEKEIVPPYYLRNEDGLPYEWIERMRRSIEVSERFTGERMFKEYKELLYGLENL
jgi:glycogen phosphorylase